MMVDEVLKYLGQYPKLMHESVMLTMLVSVFDDEFQMTPS